MRLVGRAGAISTLLLGLAACGGAISPSASPSPVASPELRKIKAAFATLVATNMVPYVAQEAGIFRKHGLDVDIQFTKDGPTTMAALVSGEVQFAQLSDPSLVNAVLQGASVQWLAVTIHVPDLSLMSQPAINSVEELKGKTLGITSQGSLTAMFAQYVLTQHGLDPKSDVKIVAVGGGPQALAALATGQIDAGIYGPPDDLRAAGLGKKVLVDFRKAGFGVPQGGLAVKKEFVKASPEVVSAYVVGFVEGIQRFKSDAALAKPIIGRVLQISETKVLDDTYQTASAAIDVDAVPRKQDQQMMLDLLAPTTPKAKDANPEDFFDDSFAKAAVATVTKQTS